MDWDSYAVQLTESPVNNIVSVETRDQPVQHIQHFPAINGI